MAKQTEMKPCPNGECRNGLVPARGQDGGWEVSTCPTCRGAGEVRA